MKKHIEQLIAQNKIEEAFQTIQNLQLESKQSNTIIVLSGNFHELKEKYQMGSITDPNYRASLNKIRLAILTLYQDILQTTDSTPQAPTHNAELIGILKHRFEKIMKLADGIDDEQETITQIKKELTILHQKHIEALGSNQKILANDIGNEIHYTLFNTFQQHALKTNIILKGGVDSSRIIYVEGICE